MHVEQVKYEMGWLCLKTQPAEALKWCFRFKEGNYELKRVRRKRSLDANAYMWALLDKLSATLGVPKEELYRRYIKELGGISEIICVPNNAVEKFRKEWEEKGIGWQTDTIPIRTPKCTGVIVYFGSSTFDTKQMSRMIDSIVEDCKSIGIETKSQAEIDSLLAEWSKT